MYALDKGTIHAPHHLFYASSVEQQYHVLCLIIFYGDSDQNNFEPFSFEYQMIKIIF
jgi:hypothetical protein